MDANRRALVDFSQTGHVNKTLDYAGDGSTCLRVPASNLDSSRRALVDFSQTGHVNKTLDYAGDARPASLAPTSTRNSSTATGQTIQTRRQRMQRRTGPIYQSVNLMYQRSVPVNSASRRRRRSSTACARRSHASRHAWQVQSAG